MYFCWPKMGMTPIFLWLFTWWHTTSTSCLLREIHQKDKRTESKWLRRQMAIWSLASLLLYCASSSLEKWKWWIMLLLTRVEKDATYLQNKIRIAVVYMKALGHYWKQKLILSSYCFHPEKQNPSYLQDRSKVMD